MSKPLRLTSAVSFAALASMIAGCAAPQQSTGFGGKANGEIGLATRALTALNANDIPTAINYAERAVEKTPNDAGFRGLLGNTYFAAGRFASAESAYRDALTLYANQPQVILKLALAEIALGKTDRAAALIQSAASMLDPADYGLALTLAGRKDEGLAALKTAARATGADARVRQNLALSYALAGDWTNARTVAAQDVPADQLEARLQNWMKLASPARASDQVASLVGVVPALTDEGQPVRLALVKTDTRLAEAAPAPAPTTISTPEAVQVAEATPATAPVEVAKPAPVPQFVAVSAPIAPAPEPVAAETAVAPAPPPANPDRVAAKVESSPAPVTMALLAAAAPEAPAAFAVLAAKSAPAPKPVKPRKAAAPAPRAVHGTSGAVVQLGAYGSPQRVNEAWAHLTDRYPALNAYLPMRAKFVSAKGTFWRLSISGFASQREAAARCQVLKSRGGSCFVRNFAGDAPVQIASR